MDVPQPIQRFMYYMHDELQNNKTQGQTTSISSIISFVLQTVRHKMPIIYVGMIHNQNACECTIL